MRHPPSLQVSIQQIKPKCHNGHTHRETTRGFGIPINPKWVDAGAVEVVEEEGGHENESFGIGEVLAIGEEEECEPKSGAFHEDPSQGWRDCRTPPWTVVLPIRGLKKFQGNESRGSYEVNG
ncbi:hypothetical protein NC653_036692 [Populus alba x Populus x berolinensis]|uniref:Uncharacterized protein n=1 Tax=Populus alba x Populus x berolinensis TaxID=444605 RepID=A0AAD6PWR6_9ROSI|nr:hypothetical protein NC653_036688 [Populus alba x Populus x berolinensis]KAJ6968798.1 hypothetical protein NC653_036692 [Populus alba x Populus x berolinensis]